MFLKFFYPTILITSLFLKSPASAVGEDDVEPCDGNRVAGYFAMASSEPIKRSARRHVFEALLVVVRSQKQLADPVALRKEVQRSLEDLTPPVGLNHAQWMDSLFGGQPLVYRRLQLITFAFGALLTTELQSTSAEAVLAQIEFTEDEPLVLLTFLSSSPVGHGLTAEHGYPAKVPRPDVALRRAAILVEAENVPKLFREFLRNCLQRRIPRRPQRNFSRLIAALEQFVELE